MPDIVKIALWVGLTAIVIGVVCLGTVAWANAGSRNLVLATSTLLAAFLLFIAQIPFELRAKIIPDFFVAEFTVDRATPQIRQWIYTIPSLKSSGWRMSAETAASSFLADHDAAKFLGDRERLTLDMVLFSLVSYLGAEQFDWQLKRTVFRGPTFGSLIQTERLSKAQECTLITSKQLQIQLTSAGNAFANANVMVVGGEICLPPMSTLTITSNSLSIFTPFCKIEFILEPSRSLSHVKPKTGGEVPQMENGEPQLETRLTGIRSSVEFSWIRAQHREMKKYEEWSDRVVQGARVWFDTPE